MFITCGVCEAQSNLVPNPSFEVNDTCPSYVSQLAHALPWFQPSWGTPDYFNTCATDWHVDVPLNWFGYQNPRTGNAYAGIFATIIIGDTAYPPYREYLEVKLDSALQAGQNYFVSFYVSLADSVNFATDDIGVLFSIDTVKNDSAFILSFIPQIENTSDNFLTNKVAWVKVAGAYIAQGGENFMTIGNFKNNANTDTLFVPGGSANFGQLDYYSAYYHVDDVCVSTDSLNCNSTVGINEVKNNKELVLIPNPFTDKINITVNRNELVEVNLFDVTARKIFNQSFTNSTSINTEKLAKGIYLYEVRNKNEVIKKGKVVKD